MNGREVVNNAKEADISNYNKHKSSREQNAELTDHHTTYRNAFGSNLYPSLTPEVEQFELADMNNLAEVENLGHGKRSEDVLLKSNSQTRSNTPLNRSYDNNLRNRTHYKQVDVDSGRLSTLVSQSATSVRIPRSRPASVSKNIPFRERSLSSFSASEGLTRPRSKNHGRHSLNVQHMSSGEDDDDISMEGLSELLGTVRQYAQEIRDIYAPIKKDEEERARRNDKRNTRRKSKELKKGQDVKCDNHETSPCYHEVRVEIHKTDDQIHDKTDDQIHERLLEEGWGTPRHEMLAHSQSHDPSAPKHVASLHVEEENLSKTWPRGQQRSTSRERYWSDVTQNKQKPYTSSSSNYFNRPKTPSDWNEAKTVQHEKEMLNKAFQRIQKPNDDPLLGTFSKSRPKSDIQKQMTNSRQSVIEVAKQHKQSRQIALPSISIISPASEFRRLSWNSPGGVLPSTLIEDKNPAIKPSAPPLEEEYESSFMIAKTDVSYENNATHENDLRQSGTRPTSERFSAKVGLARRKITDKTYQQQSTVMEKY